MKKAILIVGNSDFAKMLYRYMRECHDYEILGFVVELVYINEEKLYGLPVVPVETIEQFYSNEEVQLVLGIGYKKMGNIKKKIFHLLKEKNYSFINYIHPTAVVAENAILGEGNTILENVLIQEGVVVGDGNLIYGNSIVGHESVMGDFNSISLGVTIAGCVTIANNCFLGVSSTIRDHINLAEYVLIGATAYCSEHAKPYSVLSAPCATLLEGRKSTDFI